MSPEDIATLRRQACRVHSELAKALICLEDIEDLLNAEGLAKLRKDGEVASIAACTLMAHECAQGACSGLEAAADHLAELITATDRLATSLAPQGGEA